MFGVGRWDAHIIDEQSEQVLVHYVGGTADEDEWIHRTSDRLRYVNPKLEKPTPKCTPQMSAVRPSDTRMSMPPCGACPGTRFALLY